MIKKYSFRRGFAIALAALLIFPILPGSTKTAFAAAADGIKTTMDISRGRITIGNGTVDGWDTYGNQVFEPDPDGYIITGSSSSTSRYVTITGGTQDITLSNTSISSSFGSCSPFSITGNASVNLTLSGSNSMWVQTQSGAGYAAVFVQKGSSLTISGTGSLSAYSRGHGAAIGGHESAEVGNITINSGSITATTELAYGAGIGCGSGGLGGSVTINGGIVNATGGPYSAGIGAGRYGIHGFVNISGGTITATGKNGAAGIGDAAGYASGNPIRISGGSVNATSVSGAPTNGSQDVYPVIIGLPDANANISGLSINQGGAVSCGINDMMTDSSGRLFLYLPAYSSGNTTASVTANGVTYSGYYGAVGSIGPNALKKDQSALTLSINNAYGYGDEIVPSTTGGGGSGTVTYSYSSTGGYSGSTAPTALGEYKVKAIKAATYEYYATESMEKSFSIVQKVMSALTVEDIAAQTYTGNPVKPGVTIINGSMSLNEGIDYTLSYPDADYVNPGTVTVRINGTGNYTGTVTKTYTIVKVTAPALTVNVAQGTASGSTKANISGTASSKFVVNISAASAATVFIGDTAPTSGTGLVDGYISGADITAGVAAGKYLQVYDVDGSGKVVRFYEKQLVSGDIKTVAGALTVTVGQGTASGSTKANISGTASSKFVVNISAASAGTVFIGDTAPTSGANLINGYASGSDITAGVAAGKYLQVYDVDGSGKVVRFYEKLLVAGDIKTVAPALTVTVGQGTASGSTKANISGTASSKFVVNISAASAGTVFIGDTAPTSGANLINGYASGSDITAGVAAGKYLQVYDVDGSGKVVRFYEKQLVSGDIKTVAGALTVTVGQGIAAGSTKAIITGAAASKFVVNITSASAGTAFVGDTAPTSGTGLVDGYISGADITAGVAAGKYLQVYDVDGSGKVVRFYEKLLVAGDIKTVAPALTVTAGQGIVAGATKAIITGAASSKFVVNITAAPAGTVFVGDTAPTSGANLINGYASGSDITAGVAAGKYLQVYDVDGSGKVVRFYEKLLAQGDIKTVAGALTVTVGQGIVAGATKADITGAAASKFVVNITISSTGTVYVGDTAPTSGANLVDGYLSGADITAGVAAGKYLQVYDVDGSGKVVRFYEKLLVAGDIKTVAPALTVTAGQGIVAGATKADITGAATSKFVVNITISSAGTIYVGDTAPTSGANLINGYASGSDITAGVTAGKYLQVYDVDGSGKVVRFYEKQLVAGDIKTVASALTVTAGQGSVAGSTKANITGAAASKFVVNITAASAGTVFVGDTAPTSGANLVDGYLSDSDITTGVAAGRYLQVYDVDGSGKVVRFYEKQLASVDIKTVAPALEVTVGQGIAVGSTKADITGAAESKYVVDITTASAGTVYVGDTAPTSGAILVDGYTSGTDITSGVAAGKYLQVYDVDGSGKVVRFNEKLLVPGDIKTVAPTLTVSVAQGSVAGSIKADISGTAAAIYVVNITVASAGAVYVGDAAPTTGANLINGYASGADITTGVTAEKYLQVYDVDGSGKVVGFYEKLLVQGDIKTGGGRSSTPPPSAYKADVKSGNGPETELPVTVNNDAGTASLDLGSQNFTQDRTVISVPPIPYVNTYTLGIPVLQLSSSDAQRTLTVNTDNGSISVPFNMLKGVAGVDGNKAQISIGQADKSSLPEAAKDTVGDRPLIQLSMSIDGKQTEWNNPDAPVTVSIPYKPSAVELANPDSIVVWYIDGSGKAVSVPNGRYDPVTGNVTFSTTHFSYYAVGYNKVSFSDVAAGAWYNNAVSFIAARGITSGSENGKYGPNAKLTRGQFLVMIMRAYGLKADSTLNDNFTDAGSTYYTGYLAAAKSLGITEGIGNNMFAPKREVTRQEMFTLLYHTLETIGELPAGTNGKALTSYDDADEIASWAKDAMNRLVRCGVITGSNGKLSPKHTANRAEMAQLLYNLIEK